MDSRLYKDVNKFAIHTHWLHGFMKYYAGYGIVVFAILLLVAWWQARSTGNPPKAVAAVAWAAIGPLAAYGVGQIIGHAVGRPRPFTVFTHAEVLVHKANDFGFPSDHAVVAGAVTAGLFLVNRRLAIISTVLTLVMAVARVYVGVHYPGDVVVGLIVGAAVVLILSPIGKVPLIWLATKFDRGPLHPLISSSAPLRAPTPSGLGAHSAGRASTSAGPTGTAQPEQNS
ncbi:MAG: phosphatase PAP2 family protein [Acidimicrobiales bacterium]